MASTVPKHMRDENDRGKDQSKGSSPKKIPKATAVCEYCEKIFTTRGMPLHQNKCPKKQAHDRAAAKKTRAYKFTILNEAIHEEILSFLGNQTLTKMQMITGDRYPNCEPGLARYCCKCENDNPAIDYSTCRQCVSKGRYRYLFTTKQIAKDKYGVPEKGFRDIPYGCQRNFYDMIELEKFMIRMCGSKIKWLRRLAKMESTKMKVRATWQIKRELKAFLRTLAPEFDIYVKAWDFKETNKEILVQCSQRYVALKTRLQECGLELSWDSNPCKEFVTDGNGNIEDLVSKEACLLQQHS